MQQALGGVANRCAFVTKRRAGVAVPAARRRVVKAMAGVTREIPVFPLSVVAMPKATVPLHIFEARYRVLFNTLLDGAERVEEDLVNKESPFVGTREFGMCFIDNKGNMATTGSTLHIDEHEQLPDGRLLIVNKGIKRFRVIEVVQQRPVMICKVEELEHEEPGSPDLVLLADEVRDLFRNTMALGRKMKGVAEEDPEEPEELADLGAVDLSFWLASMFDAPMEQQHLLEMDTAVERLSREKEVLSDTLNYLRARSAIESLNFGASEGGEGGEGSEGAGGDPPTASP